jgi:hypothetical protein
MNTISTKELRLNFPLIAERIKQGEVFLLIHKSVPLAEIRRPTQIRHFTEAETTEIESASAIDLGDDDLSVAELNYYLALK